MLVEGYPFPTACVETTALCPPTKGEGFDADKEVHERNIFVCARRQKAQPFLLPRPFSVLKKGRLRPRYPLVWWGASDILVDRTASFEVLGEQVVTMNLGTSLRSRIRPCLDIKPFAVR